MSQQANPTVDPVERIVHEWLAEYARETVDENGDPDAFVDRVRALGEAAAPDSNTHRALAAFLERLDLERA